MIDAILEFIIKSCSTAACSRISMVGVILLSGWAIAHSADNRVGDATASGEKAKLTIILDNAAKEREELKLAIEKLRQEMKENNSESKRQLEKLESLLLQLLRRD